MKRIIALSLTVLFLLSTLAVGVLASTTLVPEDGVNYQGGYNPSVNSNNPSTDCGEIEAGINNPAATTGTGPNIPGQAGTVVHGYSVEIAWGSLSLTFNVDVADLGDECDPANPANWIQTWVPSTLTWTWTWDGCDDDTCCPVVPTEPEVEGTWATAAGVTGGVGLRTSNTTTAAITRDALGVRGIAVSNRSSAPVVAAVTVLNFDGLGLTIEGGAATTIRQVNGQSTNTDGANVETLYANLNMPANTSVPTISGVVGRIVVTVTMPS